MADYYSILKKTIGGLQQNTPELRQSVYVKARAAIEAQLRRLEPFPGEEAIGAQLKLLEDAIVVIESEKVSPAPEIPEAVSEEFVPSEPETQPTIPEPPIKTEMAPPMVEPVPELSTPVVSEPFVVPDPILAPAPMELENQEPAQAYPDPGLGPAVDYPDQGVPDELLDRAQEKAPEKGGAGKFLMTAVILALLGGGVYALWLNQETLTERVTTLVSSFQSENETSPETTTDAGETQTQTAEVQPDPEPTLEVDPQPIEVEEGTKQVDRLTANEEEENTVAQEPPANEDAPAPVETAATDETEPQPEDQPQQEETTAEVEEISPEPAAPSSLGEVAYLYEEGSAGSGATRSNASISWKTVQVKPSEALPAEPVIVGNMEVPEKGMTVEVNIKRNLDQALSASHIIELTFDVPDGFAGGGIENIARFVLKPTEEARGEPLVAVPVKVSDGYFLIALDNLEQAVQVNNQLMLNSSWIDIPLSYSTGKRALLTLEKGGSGEQVFKEAFSDWKNR